MEDNKLTKGQEYNVELYPTEQIVNAVYLGYSDRKYVFSTILQNEKGYLLLSDHWISIQKELISYQPISSEPIYFLSEKVKNTGEKDSRLLKILEAVEQK